MPPGQPTLYSQKKLDATRAYLADCIKTGETPFIEQLCILLDVSDETIRNWAKTHDEFFGTIKKIESLQKLRLLQMSLKKDEFTAGQIFQLKANHGMIETEKRILAGGDQNDKPINIRIIEDTSLKDAQEDQ